jgi:hypothetical protein
MARADRGHATDDAARQADDAAARQAAEVAVELTEGGERAGGPAGQRGLGKALHSVADRASAAASAAGSAARKSAGNARRGAGSVAKGAGSARRGAGSAGRGVSSGLGWLTGQVMAMGPRLKIRDQATLRARYPGLSDDEVAQKLIERAARAAAALPTLPAFPAEIAAETLAIVGIEIKLIAELHEAYGMGAPGGTIERARSYIGSWASQRGVYAVDGGLLLIAGSPLARQLTRRLGARVRRSAFSLAPLFTGVLAGALINRRETRRLGHQMRDELRQRRTTVTATVIK